jgi:hypothetical protein
VARRPGSGWLTLIAEVAVLSDDADRTSLSGDAGPFRVTPCPTRVTVPGGSTLSAPNTLSTGSTVSTRTAVSPNHRID